MATVYGSLVSNVWRSYLTYTTSETDTTFTVTLSAGLNIPTSGYKTSRGFSSSITRVGVSTPLATGSIGTGSRTGTTSVKIAPSSSNTVSTTINKTTSAQSVTFKAVLDGTGISTNSTASVTITISKKTSYAVTLNANGGTNPPTTSLTKWYGESLTVYNNSNKPTRSNYTFLGWSTNKSATTATYTSTNPNYTTNAKVTLYAIWKRHYISPTITNLESYRVASSGSTTQSDTGEVIYVKFKAAGGSSDGGASYLMSTCGITINGTSVYSSSISNLFSLSTDTAVDANKTYYTISSSSYTVVSPSGSENPSSQGWYEKDFFEGWYSTYTVNTPHTVVITVSDSGYTSYAVSSTTTIPAATFQIDLLPDITIPSTPFSYMGIMTPAVPGQKLTLSDETYIDGDRIIDFVVEKGTIGNGIYCKWHSGRAEFWAHIYSANGMTTTAWTSPIYYADRTDWANIWSGVFNASPTYVYTTSSNSQFLSVYPYNYNSSGIASLRFISVGAKSNAEYGFSVYAVGTWK